MPKFRTRDEHVKAARVRRWPVTSVLLLWERASSLAQTAKVRLRAGAKCLLCCREQAPCEHYKVWDKSRTSRMKIKYQNLTKYVNVPLQVTQTTILWLTWGQEGVCMCVWEGGWLVVDHFTTQSLYQVQTNVRTAVPRIANWSPLSNQHHLIQTAPPRRGSCSEI